MAATKMVFITLFSSSTHLKVQVFRSGFGYTCFSDMEDFWARRLPGSLVMESSPMSPFHNRSERFGFNQMVLIFHLDISGSDFGRPIRSLLGSLLGSLLKYNALEDFEEVFQTTTKKSSRRLPGSVLTGSSSISSGV
ncbi:hypothetical protein F2Q70_00015179 [Brassica cretica]|uniref:Uncharacterized protein n=1 Tax=Brassica cretica TaxID=69181 RepID=A0A8S9I5V0_BRACR|nr:hypothetical protein F2Q70_00015179 [Brassica cretica]